MRTRIPLLVLALLGLGLAAPSTGHAAFITAIGDQQPAMFSNPLFKQLGIKHARFITGWDTVNVRFERERADAWLNAARLNGVQPLVSFYHSRDGRKALRNPTLGQYESAFRKFRQRYPFVKVFSPWNEANHTDPSRRRFANPSGKLAAQYYEIVRRNCARCKIVGLDVLDTTNPARNTLPYIRSFMKNVRHRPKIWGIHNYSDTNRFRNRGTKAIIRQIGRGEFWLTETGGVVKFGRNFPFSENRAARALKFMFTLAKSNSRIRRLYIFQWTGDTPDATFDAGLIRPDGTPRPGYDVVRRHLRR